MSPLTPLSALLLLCSLLVAARGSAQAPGTDSPHLTSRGRQMVGGSVGGYWSNDRPSDLEGYDQWAVYAHPSWVYFVRDHIGLGLSVGGGTSHTKTYSAVRDISWKDWDVSVGAQAVLEVPLTRRLSLMFEPYIGYLRKHRDITFSPDKQRSFDALPGALFQQPYLFRQLATSTTSYVRFALSAPLVFHVSESVGIGFGPDFWLDVFVTRTGGVRTPRESFRTQVGASSALYFSF